MKGHFLFIGIITISIALHSFLRYETFSFFMFPLALGTLLSHIKPSALAPLLLLIIISELFTSLPLGIMTCVILIPFLVRMPFQRISADISLTFLTLITGTIWLQLTFLLLVSIAIAWPEPFSWEAVFYLLPIRALAGIGIVTPLITYLLAVSWHELTPRQHMITTISTLPSTKRYL